LKQSIEDAYKINILDIKLYRDMIGKVYHIKTKGKSYIFKIYRSSQKETALNSLQILTYLYQQKGPVAKIYLTKSNQSYIDINNELGVLYDYVNGNHADKIKNEALILDATNKMHDIMKSYPYQLIKRDQSFYIDRYIKILEDVHFDEHKINHLKDLGYYFFNQILHLPKGFCHGDLHNENIIINQDHKAIIIDFDVSGYLSPLIDYMTLYDQTHFNKFNKDDVFKTIEILNKLSIIDQDMITYMLAMIPVRHYEILATILNMQGLDQVNLNLFEEQYDWISQFYDAYKKL
jgi:Ser/Thr protein kinase RdoA (MazF antagonist)